MGLWTKIRNTAQSAAVIAGNYYVPGSSALTSKVVAKGSQKQLGSTVGVIAQLGSSAVGLGIGSGTTGIQASTVGAKMSAAAQSAVSGISGLFNKSPMPTSMAEMPGNTPIMAEDQSTSTPIYDSLGNIIGGSLAVAGAGAQAAGKLATSSVNAMAASASNPLSGTYSGPSGYSVGASDMPPVMGGSDSPIIIGGPSGSSFNMKDIMVPAILLAGAFLLKG